MHAFQSQAMAPTVGSCSVCMERHPRASERPIEPCARPNLATVRAHAQVCLHVCLLGMQGRAQAGQSASDVADRQRLMRLQPTTRSTATATTGSQNPGSSDWKIAEHGLDGGPERPEGTADQPGDPVGEGAHEIARCVHGPSVRDPSTPAAVRARRSPSRRRSSARRPRRGRAGPCPRRRSGTPIRSGQRRRPCP